MKELNFPRNEISALLQLVSEGGERAYRDIFETYKTIIYSTTLNLSDDEFIAEEEEFSRKEVSKILQVSSKTSLNNKKKSYFTTTTNLCKLEVYRDKI